MHSENMTNRMYGQRKVQECFQTLPLIALASSNIVSNIKKEPGFWLVPSSSNRVLCSCEASWTEEV